MSTPSDPAASAGADPRARMHAAYAALPGLLSRHEPADPVVLAARIELARACSAAGQHEDALYQVDELVRDALRAHGEGHPITGEARTALADVQRAAGMTEQ